MKNIFLILAAIGLVAITVSFVPAISKSSSSNGSKQLTTSAIPDDVKAIFEKSCMGCHSDDASGFAKSKVNFSKWDSYEPAKQAAKGSDICNVLTKAKMPPKSVRKSKPELVPTKEQIDLICKWSQTLGK
jgi:hypothetical protein